MIIIVAKRVFDVVNHRFTASFNYKTRRLYDKNQVFAYGQYFFAA